VCVAAAASERRADITRFDAGAEEDSGGCADDCAKERVYLLRRVLECALSVTVTPPSRRKW
jgi:hypothetical protein